MIMLAQPLPDYLHKNALIADATRTGPDKNLPAVDRVCWVDAENDAVGLIEVTDINALPRVEYISEIVKGFKEGSLRIWSEDTWSAPLLQIVDSDSEKKKKRIRDNIERAKNHFKKIEDLLKNHLYELFDPSNRGKLIRELVENKVTTKPSAMKYIRLYFRRGMVINALATDHDNCGAPGVVRNPGKEKRGRKPKPENRTAEKPGINIDEKTRLILEQAWETFRVKKKYKIAKAYRSMLERHFSIGYTVELGKITPIFPPEDELPTIGQFKYWGTRNRAKRLDAIASVSQHKVHLKHRETFGSSREGIIGPGSQFQVDATGGLVHLVARDDPQVRIGKAVMYGICDAYSQLVPGWVTALENASYAVLATVFERAFTDKVEYCKRLGIEITSDEWPFFICDAVLGDCGSELLGMQADNLTNAFGFRFLDTATGRADWKAYIERQFGHFKENLRDVSGASWKQKERGEPDPRDTACWTLDDQELLATHHVLTFNHSYIVKDHIHEIHLLALSLATTPINFWNWGVMNITGIGRYFSKEQVRAAVLPKANVPATRDGLKFKDLQYYSSVLKGKGEFLRGTGHKRNRFMISYDPRDLSEIWLLDSNYRLVDVCPLTSKYKHLRGISLWELEAIRSAKASIQVDANTRRLEHQAALDKVQAEIEKKAKERHAAAGGGKVVYDQQAHKKEQAERRTENAWTNNVAPSKKSTDRSEPSIGYKYIPEPDYSDALDEPEEVLS